MINYEKLNNTQLDTVVNLSEELPKFMAELREFQYILKNEDIELQLIYYRLKKTLFNTFISTCDHEGIKVFEYLLNGFIDESLPLETRRYQVLSGWQGELPYTYRNLIKKLDFLLGKDQYNLLIDYDKYNISIETHIPDYNRNNIVINSLRGFIPANMGIKQNNTVRYTINGNTYYGNVIAEFRSYRIGG